MMPILLRRISLAIVSQKPTENNLAIANFDAQRYVIC
jgi:hypothetical protein